MKLYVGVTDKNWYEQLKAAEAKEANFWRPGTSPFRALDEGDLFLFKLHAPFNFIVGGGFFVSYSLLPTFLAWDAFGTTNGVQSLDELNSRIAKYRGRNDISMSNPEIGCIILTDCFWLDESQWIPQPEDWKTNTVQGKVYSDSNEIGKSLFKAVQEKVSLSEQSLIVSSANIPNGERYSYGKARHRLGQGAFRVLVTDAYSRRCAITGEKTLPVLQAAHIKPYNKEGPHLIENGILLRSDFHTLFDDGYITITTDYRIEVSDKLHADYGNGKDYYRYHGQNLLIMPDSPVNYPSPEFLRYHNETVYKG